MSEQDYQKFEPLTELVHVKRTDKVVKGGTKLSFSALVVAGDGQSKVGYGLGKGSEVSIAIKKATDEAMKNMFKVKLNGHTLQHPVESREGATRVFMKPASDGTGIIAGGAMRPVFKVLGVQNVLAKIIGSGNPLNVVKATIHGLNGMADPLQVAKRRHINVNKLFEKE